MRLLSTLLLCSASVAAFATTAHAQDSAPAAEADTAATDTESYASDVIIVQARRRDESVQDVPAVIDTVTADDVAKLNIRDFKDVAAIVPGLQLTTEANGVGGGAKLRGMNFDVSASGNNPTVEFYFNDAPITAGVILQQMYDIGQIEVQRGPQGTLRGRAAPSGSITVSAKKPDLYDFGGFVDATANDIGTLNFKGGVNIPVIEGIAAIRAAGVWDENEGDRVKPLEGNGRSPYSRTKSGRVSAIIQPTDFIKLEGMYQTLDRQAYTYNQAASLSEADPNAPESPVYISTKDRLSIQEQARPIHQKYDIYNWRSEVSGFGQVLIYQGQHYTQEITATDNQDAGDFFPGDVVQHTASHISSTSHEIRLQNEDRIIDIFDYVVGYFDYKNDTPTELTRPTMLGLPNGTLLRVVQTPVERTGESHEKSVFANLTAHIGDKTEISGGVRHIDYTALNQTVVNGSIVPVDPTDPTKLDSQDDSKWIYAASVKHNFTPDFMVYANTGSSWRPGISVVGDFSLNKSALESSFLFLPAESSKSYEIGFKSNLFDRRVRLNVSAYHQKFKNYPYRIPGQGVYFVNTVAQRDDAGAVIGTAQQVAQFNFAGAVPVEVNGIEGDINFKVNDNWDLGVSGSYSMGKIKNGTIPCNDLNGDGIPDAVTSAPSLEDLQAAVGANNISACQVSQRSSFLPPFSATVNTEYRFDLNDAMGAYVRGLLSFNGASQTDPANAFDDVSSYGLLNVFAGVRAPDGSWEVSLFAKNLLDTTKTLSRTEPLFTSYLIPTGGTSTTSATYSSTYAGVTTTPLREFGINIRYAFGSR